MADKPSRILVEISTSNSTLSKSGNPPFTITIEATVDGSRPITIYTFPIVLSRSGRALDYQGLTFRDIISGKLAERIVIDVQYSVTDTLTANSDSVVEIPPKDDSEPFTVRHTFRTPNTEASVPEQRASEARCEEMSNFTKDVMRMMSDQTVGLKVGNTYEIGLGNDMSQVSWWRPGSKAEVFARGSVGRRAEGLKLKLELVKTATFMVGE
nr:hypothetical protein CFP56_11927 [Quercus suber]